MLRMQTHGLLAGLLIGIGGSLAMAADKFEVDKVHSAVIFRVQHMGVSYSYGRFNEISGNFTFDESDPAKSEVKIEVKADSVDTADDKRDQHLKGPDFFNTKQFPVIGFVSKSVKKLETNVYEVTGDLTLHGVTKPLTTRVEWVGSGKDPWGGFRGGFETTFTIKRSDFGMNYMPDALGDDIKIIASLEGIRK